MKTRREGYPQMTSSVNAKSRLHSRAKANGMPRPAHLAKEAEQNTSEDPLTKVKDIPSDRIYILYDKKEAITTEDPQLSDSVKVY